MEHMPSPAGILMHAQKPTPVVLGHTALPAMRDLHNLGVDPYRVDSWPIEPNSRYARPSQVDLALPATQEEAEEQVQAELAYEPPEPEEPEAVSESGDQLELPAEILAAAATPVKAAPEAGLSECDALTPEDLPAALAPEDKTA